MTIKQRINRQAILALAHTNFSKKLNIHAFFKVSNHAIGQDLVQDTFLKAWKYMAKGGKIDVMKSFLYRILNNLIIDEYRRKKADSLDAQIENGFEPSVDDSNRLFNMLDGSAAMMLIKKLPMVYRNVMSMRYEQDLTLQEMSDASGQTKNSLAVQLHRGLGKLKILYADQAVIV